MAETVDVSATTQADAVQVTEQPKPETKKAPSAAVLKHREELKVMRQVKVDYKAPGATLATVAATSPKKTGSKAREVWDLYAVGMTVADLLTKAEKTRGGRSYAQACIQWDVRHGYITLGVAAPKAEEPKAEPQAEPAAQ